MDVEMSNSLVHLQKLILGTLQWLNVQFANNIEIEMLNFITEPQEIPGPWDIRNLPFLRYVLDLLLNTAKKA